LISCSDGEGNTDSRDIDDDDDDESNDKNNENDVGGGDDNGVDHVEDAAIPNDQATIHMV